MQSEHFHVCDTDVTSFVPSQQRTADNRFVYLLYCPLTFLTIIAGGGLVPLTSTKISSYLSKLTPDSYWEKMDSSSSEGGGGT